MKRIFAGSILAACCCLGAQAAVLPDTAQNTEASISANGQLEVDNGDAQHNGFASTQAIWPRNAGPGAGQARSAGRSGDVEIAANARLSSEVPSATFFDEVKGFAGYTINAPEGHTPFEGGFDFHLPASYVEIQTNVEFPHDQLEASIQAVLNIHVTPPGSWTESSVLSFYAKLAGTYENMVLTHSVTGNPALDLTPLATPVVTDVQDTFGMFRTYNATFGELTGHVDLGLLPAGTAVFVDYRLYAKVLGTARFSSAIAAINDPFFLSTDPVTPGAPITFAAPPAPVPLPPALALFAPLAGLLVGRRR